MNLLDEPQQAALAVRKTPNEKCEEMMTETHLNELICFSKG